MPKQSQIVCPSCGGVNRIRPDRPAQQAHCGRCHQPLFTGQPVSLDSQSFDTHVGRSDVPVVVDFWAQWCGPCQMMAPAFAEAAAELEPRVRLAKLDTEQNQDVAARNGIRSIPTTILFKGGREAARISGALDRNRLVSWVQQNL